jgi:hypothetical protein
MHCYIIVAEPTGVALLKEILRPQVVERPLTIREGGVKSDAGRRARSLLVFRRDPVVVVTDTKTNDPASVEELRDYVEYGLSEAARRDRWKVCMAVPELEICFFDDPSFVEQLFQTKLSEGDKVRAEFRPKEVLARLFQQKQIPYTEAGIAQFLGSQDLSPVRQSRLIREILEGVDALTAKVAVPAAKK